MIKVKKISGSGIFQNGFDDRIIEFDKIVSGVQRNNVQAIRLYKKLGFSIVDNPANDKSLIVSAAKDILDREPVLKLIDRYNNRVRRTSISTACDV